MPFGRKKRVQKRKARIQLPPALAGSLNKAAGEGHYAFVQIEKDMKVMSKALYHGDYRTAIAAVASAAAQSGVLNRSLVEVEDIVTQIEQKSQAPAELQGTGPHIWKQV
jgi:hypothetical protein